MNYHFDRNLPLNPQDTETQTYGCRAYNPDICINCMGPTCGLTNENHICKTPPKTWKKQYEALKQKL